MVNFIIIQVFNIKINIYGAGIGVDRWDEKKIKEIVNYIWWSRKKYQIGDFTQRNILKSQGAILLILPFYESIIYNIHNICIDLILLCRISSCSIRCENLYLLL